MLLCTGVGQHTTPELRVALPFVHVPASLACGVSPPAADPVVLATAPCLAEVHAPACAPDQQARMAAWRQQLAALRPDVRITPSPPSDDKQ